MKTNARQSAEGMAHSAQSEAGTQELKKRVPAAQNAERGPVVGVEPYIDKHEVARRLGRTIRSVDNWMSRGLIPYYKIGRSVDFKWSEIEERLRQNCWVCRRSVRAGRANMENED